MYKMPGGGGSARRRGAQARSWPSHQVGCLGVCTSGRSVWGAAAYPVEAILCGEHSGDHLVRAGTDRRIALSMYVVFLCTYS